MNSLAVLLATYNGERYLQAQLDSLWHQTYQDFQLVIRDDGSSDGTQRILQELQQRMPNRVKVVSDDKGRLGPKGCFAELMRSTSSRYIAFCDQDDYWLPNKLEFSIKAILKEEERFGSSTPILCAGDAIVTDSELNITHNSYYEKHNISVEDGRDLALPRLIFRNYAIGATAMINNALLGICKNMPQEAIMHDWWCALVASTVGRPVILSEPLMLYRQHGSNAVGSRRRDFPRTKAQALEYLSLTKASSARCVSQASAVYSIVHDRIDKSTDALLSLVRSLPDDSSVRRGLTMLRLKAFKPGILLNALHIYSCMFADYQYVSQS